MQEYFYNDLIIDKNRLDADLETYFVERDSTAPNK